MIPKEFRKMAGTVATVAAVIAGTAGYTTGHQASANGGFYSHDRGVALESRVDRIEQRTLHALESIVAELKELRAQR